ncbi:AAA family ATPase, partial [Microcoleus sp. HI-ES]|nr:AAA family ATPase [Microcoleus sp. HI-ES]
MQEEISILIQAQYPLIYLVTSEEERCEQAISTIAQAKPQRRVFIWTVTHGIVEYGQPRTTTQHNTVSPEAAIEWVIRQREPNSNASIYIFKDLHPFID